MLPHRRARLTGTGEEERSSTCSRLTTWGLGAQLGLGAGHTIEAPGSTQAFRRSELITVELEGSEATIRRPNMIGALLGKVAAVLKTHSQTAAERAKHVRDADALARLLGVEDRRVAALTEAECKLLERCAAEIDLSALAAAQLRLLLAPSKD